MYYEAVTYHKKGDPMKFRHVVLLILATFLVIACGNASAPSDQSAAPADTSVGSDEPTPAESEQPQTAESTDANATGDTGNVWTPSTYAQNLQALDSYTLTFSYAVTLNGKEDTWSWKQSSQRNPVVSMSIWQSTNTGDTQTMLVTTADKTYMVSGDPQSCIIVANVDENTNIFKPETILDTFGYDLVAAGAGPDVNGRPTDKYTYDNRLDDGTSYRSTVIVDRQDRYTMQWDVEGTTKNGDAFEPFRWSYVLSDINAVPALQLPSECTAMADTSWPKPEDAVVSMQTGEMASFTTAGSITDTAKFYAKALPAAGYTSIEGGMDTADMVMQMYSKDGKQISVVITAADGKTTIIITNN